jgi:hypothetical protein
MKLREWMSRAGFVAAVVAVRIHASAGSAQDTPSMQAVSAKPQQLVIIDADIGDDIDDVFAVGLALSSSELRILGIMSEWGDTALKSRLLDRLLCKTGMPDIPVATGIADKATLRRHDGRSVSRISRTPPVQRAAAAGRTGLHGRSHGAG